MPARPTAASAPCTSPTRPLHRAGRQTLLLGLCLVALAGAARAQEAVDAVPAVVEPAGPGLSYALGLALIAQPTYAGASGQQLKPRPLWALRWGRFRVSGARASGLLASPGDGGSGASAELLRTANWQVGAALRFDTGRKSSDDPALAGLPDVRRTLRGRLFSSVDLGQARRLSLGYSQDLLGRGGGGSASVDLGQAWPLWGDAAVSVGAGLAVADGRYMRTHFGISPAAAQASGRPVYEPGAGLLDLHLGSSVRVPLGRHWLVVAALGSSRLMGPAADSPLTSRRSGTTAALTLAWRTP